MLNTSVAVLPNTGTILLCAAARLPPIVFQPYVDLPLGSAFVLIYEQVRSVARFDGLLPRRMMEDLRHIASRGECS